MTKPPLADSALILAGGRSSRMGFDKKDLILGRKRVFDALAAKLTKLFGQLLVSSNTELKGYEVLADDIGSGPLAGILQGLRRCRSRYLYVIACDMPFLNPDYLEHMRQIIEKENCDVCLTGRPDGRYEPFNAFYSVNCLETVEKGLEEEIFKIRPVLDRLDVHVVPPEEAARFNSEVMFFNVNKPEDLKRAEELGLGEEF
ncbi:MAG: molybdenum cofactor guanylyltransferase [Deltaproteobacteria bacterium]|jgi:molybdopterin-guanine dinucleotide biosynthesis protein A|nr:molybdenum cofactor guanylyltransferase [Deltaproteobacteria bacterium]